MRVYPRHRLDLTPRHLLYAVAACGRPGDAGELGRRILARSGRDDGIVCMSVRAGFELLLDALELPSGSEVAVSAVTHPDMCRIIQRHGLRAVPVDIDEDKLAPRLDLLEEAITSRTRAILVAHLFGSRFDVAPVAELASERGLLLWEDCAQSLRGPTDSGHPSADVAMFSFGAIKTCPALGGAIMYVRDDAVRARMQAIQERWPAQTRCAHLKRVVWFTVLMCLGAPAIFGIFTRTAALFGADVESFVNATVHAVRPPSVADDPRFTSWLRRRPSVPLLALLDRRLRGFDTERLRRRAALGEEMTRRLPSRVAHPGRGAADRTHWVFPVVVDDPTRLIRELRTVGFDATSRTTSITAIVDANGEPAPTAERVMAHIVFLPVYPELPPRARRDLVAALEVYARSEGCP